MIIAEFAIFPTSEGVSVSRFVKEAIKIIENSGLHSETGGMSTTIEAPSLDQLFEVIKKTHEALVKMGVKRIHIDLRIDHRLDKDATITSKLKAVGKR
ncbi:MAG: MTH1187 family thiamine-binding protein [Candidatus Aminicenantes bacterium]|nr:MTH1187 family thiamine-binding protein [Candidatus Aminicenantes bacterium]